MMRSALFLAGGLTMLAVPFAVADSPNSTAGLPGNALIDESLDVKTAWPYPTEGAGTYELRAHGRDLRQWLSLSYEDRRGIPEPTEVAFEGPVNGDPERGKEIFTTTAEGNCVACHYVEGVAQTGTVGPSLADYAARGMPDEYTYQMLYDARVFYEGTLMPPFGAFNNLTEQEIHDVMAYMATLK
ncbi:MULTISPECIES: sulfur oxidation c-type cytochrome SoxX [unclassified Thioalkalivibrio]|uniref:sulfur oxidation c-type cytochrome SoxX n=1 Tax=unclassified Thioalkalivibrio TaxID=2621013 RepID=UPI00035D209D|nr:MULTISPECIES: sulfur oxidation c-type cytochrome SoxX [unclassified Thioalkalivibrio]